MNNSENETIISIKFLDYSSIELKDHEKSYGCELLDIACKHINLKSQKFFGLCYNLDIVNKGIEWIILDRRLCDHDFFKKSGINFQLNFKVRFFVESVCFLEDVVAIEMFYLQAKVLISNESLICDSSTIFDLAAMVLQEKYGDFIEEQETCKYLKDLPVLPTYTFHTYPSIDYCECEIIKRYQDLKGTSKGLALLKYMTLIERQSSYGEEKFDVKDKQGIPWKLAIGPRGLSLYDHNDLRIPRRSYPWKRLDNIFVKDKKFCISISDAKKLGKNSSTRRSFRRSITSVVYTPIVYTPGAQQKMQQPILQSSEVFSWYTQSVQTAKRLWSTAVAQHHFHQEQNLRSRSSTFRTFKDIADEITTGLTTGANIENHPIVITNKNTVISDISDTKTEIDKRKSVISDTSSMSEDKRRSLLVEQLEEYKRLKVRKDSLELLLKRKLQLYKLMCLEEMEITGLMPSDVDAVGSYQEETDGRLARSSGAYDNLYDEAQILDNFGKIAILNTNEDLTATSSPINTPSNILNQENISNICITPKNNLINTKNELKTNNLSSKPPIKPAFSYCQDTGYIPSPIYSTRTQYRSRTYPTLTSHLSNPGVSNQNDSSQGSVELCVSADQLACTDLELKMTSSNNCPPTNSKSVDALKDEYLWGGSYSSDVDVSFYGKEYNYKCKKTSNKYYDKTFSTRSASHLPIVLDAMKDDIPPQMTLSLTSDSFESSGVFSMPNSNAISSPNFLSSSPYGPISNWMMSSMMSHISPISTEFTSSKTSLLTQRGRKIEIIHTNEVAALHERAACWHKK